MRLGLLFHCAFWTVGFSVVEDDFYRFQHPDVPLKTAKAVLRSQSTLFVECLVRMKQSLELRSGTLALDGSTKAYRKTLNAMLYPVVKAHVLPTLWRTLPFVIGKHGFSLFLVLRAICEEVRQSGANCLCAFSRCSRC